MLPDPGWERALVIAGAVSGKGGRARASSGDTKVPGAGGRGGKWGQVPGRPNGGRGGRWHGVRMGGKGQGSGHLNPYRLPSINPPATACPVGVMGKQI